MTTVIFYHSPSRGHLKPLICCVQYFLDSRGCLCQPVAVNQPTHHAKPAVTAVPKQTTGPTAASAPSLPEESLLQLTEFVELLESLESLEQLGQASPVCAHLPALTRQTLLTEIETFLDQHQAQRRTASSPSKPSSARMTLARLKRDARQALDIESINFQQSTSVR